MKVVNLVKEKTGPELLEEIISEFDFYKVRDVMLYLDWRWAFINATPQISEMKDWVRQLSEPAFKFFKEKPSQKKYSTASGGFEIEMFRDFEGGEPTMIEIKFVLTSYGNN